MADGEDIVCVPNLIGTVLGHDVFEFRRAVDEAAPPMRIAEYCVRAPVAFVRTPARGDHVDAAHAMLLAPYIDIARLIDAAAVRPGNRIQIRDLRTLRSGQRHAGFVMKYDAFHLMQAVCTARR